MKKVVNKISATKVIFTSFGVDFLDISFNLIVIIMTGSVVMLAELVQGISDLFASSLLLIGLYRPRKEAHFWTLTSAIVMMCLASTLSFYFGWQRFFNPREIENIFIAYAALVFSTISNGYAFILSAKRILNQNQDFSQVFKKFHDSPFLMTKNTFVLDLMGMSAALVGLVALILYQVTGELRFDGLGAMGIGLVLGLLSLKLVVDIKTGANDRSVGREL